MTAAPRPVHVHEADDPAGHVDVIVVGLGAAGACAAIEAARAGADTLVLERTTGGGGSSAMSGGELYLGGGTALQQACGFDDTPQAMYDFLHAAIGPHVDEAKLRAYCDGSVEHYDWLVDAGVPFGEGLYEHPTWMPPTEHGLMWLGENAWPFTEIAPPVPRGHRPGAPYFAGADLMTALIAAADEAGSRTRFDTTVDQLVVDDDGRVVGVVARRFADREVWLAHRGVVLTTGGFVDNDAMVEDHAPALASHGKVSDGLDDGSGIAMAVALGAATRRMGAVETSLTYVPPVAVRGIVVNHRGERFINEDSYPGLLSHAAVHHGHLPIWMIVDERGWDEVDEIDRWGAQPEHVAATPEELESDLGMPAQTLAATIHTYNLHAAEGHDPTHHKQPQWVRPLEGRLAAVRPPIMPGQEASGVAGFTLGGLHTTVDGAVLDTCGDPVPGLYAAGRASAGIHGDNYISGTSLGDGTFFGRRAGRTVAATDPSRSDPIEVA